MKWKHKSWITIWLIAVCAALLVIGTYAAYTKVEYVKRVVAAKDGSETELFSSNYLYRRDTVGEYPLRMIPVGTQNDASVTVTVCNYLQSDLTKANEADITYTLTATLVDADGNTMDLGKEFSYKNGETDATITGAALAGEIKINGKGFTGGTYTSSGTLTGGETHADLYTITCPQAYISILSEVGIQMCAESAGVSKKLVAQLRLGAGNQQPTSWKGSFDNIASLPDDAFTTEYHAFNYTISGTMEQTLRLSWDASKVTLDRWFWEDFGSPKKKNDPEKEGWIYIDINVGGQGQPTSYTLQFYRMGRIPDDETAADVRGYVAYVKVEQTENQN